MPGLAPGISLWKVHFLALLAATFRAETSLALLPGHDDR
jgi:NO-binding membrane sensor protein with MHYT domain